MSVQSSNERICKICNKYYKSRQSLWNHNKKYHNNVYTDLQIKFIKNYYNLKLLKIVTN